MDGDDLDQGEPQNMLVIDPNDQNAEYQQMDEMNGQFGPNDAPYHAHDDPNLVPRDVIPEEENERTQDSAMLNRITEERDDTRKGDSNYDMSSKSSPPKALGSGSKQNLKPNKNEDDYESDYEDPIETKPFENTANNEPVDQSDVLKMIAKPVDRPTTRNPRMASRGQSAKSHNRDESMGEMNHSDIKDDPESSKIDQEIKGDGFGFELPGDSD